MDNNLDKKMEQEKLMQPLNEYLKDMSEELKQDYKIPVDNKCQLDINAFQNIYSTNEIKNDQQEIEKMEQEFADKEELSIKVWRERKDSGLLKGEQLERLKTALFHKNLDANFIVLRGSKFDDYKHGVDNIIIDKETNNIIGAFDEVADKPDGERTKVKKEKTTRQNTVHGGSKIKYGIKFDHNNEKTYLQSIYNVPIFYLSLDKAGIDEALNKFGRDNNFEQELFTHFITQISLQINEMEKKNINYRLKKQWSSFNKFINKIKKS